MIALILAAGYATRLYPLTLDTPKPLLPVQGSRTILDLLAERLEVLEEISEILVVTNERFFHAFEEWAGQYQGSKPVRILNDGTSSPEGRLGAIGDIQFVLERMQPQEDLLVLAGDNVLGFGLAGYLDYFHKVDTDCILVRTVDDPAELRSIGVAELDAQNRVLSLEEKPQAPARTLAYSRCTFTNGLRCRCSPVIWLKGATRMRRVTFPNGCIPVRRCGLTIPRVR